MDKILYRDCKRWLEESMKTVVEIWSEQELDNHLNISYANDGKEIVETSYAYLGISPRTNWDTYLVLIQFKEEKEPRVVGMTNWVFDATTATIHTLKKALQ
jgi:hypothetical protein